MPDRPEDDTDSSTDSSDTGSGGDGAALLEFLAVMRRLRAECGWKREQTHRTLARYLVEELHETLEALDGWSSGDAESPGHAEHADHVREELGDLLLQVFFHAVVAEEAGDFTVDDVARGVTAKMRRRNPHVFGAGDDTPTPTDPAEINELWQSVKATEKQRDSVTDGLPASLPALLWADKVVDRLRREGVALPAPTEVRPERPTATEDEVGERLLAVVVDAQAAGVDPEQALRVVVRRLLPPTPE